MHTPDTAEFTADLTEIESTSELIFTALARVTLDDEPPTLMPPPCMEETDGVWLFTELALFDLLVAADESKAALEDWRAAKRLAVAA
jgi:hypothetical protein